MTTKIQDTKLSETKSTNNITSVMGGVDKMPTGIPGFDSILEGGMPKDRTLLIAGSTGTGKTVFTNEFIYRGITEYKENGVYVTFEERPDDLIKNVRNFGWDFDKLIKENKLAFVDVSPEKTSVKVTGEYDLSSLIERIKYAVKKVNAKRVAIDALSMLFSRFQDKELIRDTIFMICDELKSMGVTSMITAEKPDGQTNSFSRYGVEEYVVDGVVELWVETGQQQFLRKMFIKKLRGTGYRSGTIEFEITNKGLEVFPKIDVDRRISKTNFEKREKFGIKGLDESMGGGIPQGHGVLISGNTGTGKSLLNMHFVVQGIKEGENAIYVALEEPVDQIKKTARVFDFDFDKYEKEGKLTFVSPSLIDISNDKLLNDIVKAVNKSGAKRVVFDSISSLQSATMSEEDVRQFLIQVTGFFKTKGVTNLMNYLSSNNFGAEKDQLLAMMETNMMRLSSVLDGIIVLLYVERDQVINRLLFVLKMRGSWHSNSIFQYEINSDGINIGEKFNR
jgi:circadian clock protein KaiC